MALFTSDVSDALKRLAAKSYATQEERDELLGRIESADVRAREVVWMMFRPDRALRDAASRVLMRIRDAETIDVFIGEVRGKPEQALRAAATGLFALGLPGIEGRLIQLLAPVTKETKETREIQDAARRLLLEAPASRQLDPLLWQFAAAGPTDERLPFLTKIAAAEMDENALRRWRRLAIDPETPIREKAIEVLATRAPQHSVDVLIDALPRSGYGIQQIIVDALTKIAAGPERAAVPGRPPPPPA